MQNLFKDSSPKASTTHRPFSRRQFLQWLGMTGLAALVSACRAGTKEPAPLPSSTNTPTSRPSPSATPSPIPTHTQTLTRQISPPPSFTDTPTRPLNSPTPLPEALAAIGQASTYEPSLIRQQLESMLGAIGGLDGLVKPGMRVGLKVNLTGGTWWDTPEKPPANELFVTHPAVVGALAELLLDAGASQITVMDGLGDERNFANWGYVEMAKPLGLKLLDLNKPDPYLDYTRYPVGGKSQVYEVFYCNGLLQEMDVLVSVAKMKCHSVAGVTLSLKNLIGMAPTSKYRLKPEHNNRSAFHGSSDYDTRLPRVILDLNQAFPIRLALVDGVITAEAGAGPWDAGLSQVRPGLLVAGWNPVATDAVSAALMGFNPEAESGSLPFKHSENHLALAREAGLGTNQLEKIGIQGPSIQEAFYPFKPVQ